MTTAALAAARRDPRAAGHRNAFHALLGALGALHALMWLYDLAHPERFLNGDRAQVRIEVIERFGETLRNGGDLAAFFAGHGIPGDWLPQALLYLAGGPPLVIAAQVVLALASVAWVRGIGLRLALTPGQASGAAALYALLPHSLVFPHQLVSEAIFVPLVVLSFALVLRSPTARGQAAAGLALGIATLVRPITMLWPVVHALCAWRAAPAARLAYLAAGLAPLLLWMAFIHAETGDWSMGPSKHDLGHNLYNRVQRMAPDLPPQERFADREGARLGMAEYLRFVAAHPGLAAAHGARDLAALGAKSGIERVLLDYLDLYPEQRRELQDWTGGWRQRLEAEGPVRAFMAMAAANPALVLASGAGALLFAALMVLAVVGALTLAWRGRFMLAFFVVYVMLTAMVVDAAQSRHRAPAEFALCLLAVAGIAALRRSHEREPGIHHGR